jgi:DNA-3-methyladenine glycosylase
MDLDKRLHGHDLLSREFHIVDPGDPPPKRIVRRPRIGVDYAGHWARRLLRFYEHGNPYVSRK